MFHFLVKIITIVLGKILFVLYDARNSSHDRSCERIMRTNHANESCESCERIMRSFGSHHVISHLRAYSPRTDFQTKHGFISYYVGGYHQEPLTTPVPSRAIPCHPMPSHTSQSLLLSIWIDRWGNLALESQGNWWCMGLGERGWGLGEGDGWGLGEGNGWGSGFGWGHGDRFGDRFGDGSGHVDWGRGGLGGDSGDVGCKRIGHNFVIRNGFDPGFLFLA